MGILFPIDDEGAGTAPILSAAGSSLVTGALGVANHVRGAAAGVGRASGALSLGAGGSVALAGVSVGASMPTARLRLNNEANVFFAGSSAGTSEASLSATMTASIAGRSDGLSSASLNLAVERAEEFGFTIFLDITGDALTGAGRMRRYAAALKSDGTPLPARSIVERAAPGALGVTLDITLASPERAAVAAASNLEFDVGVWGGSDFAWQTLLTNGVRASDTASYTNDRQRPADRVSFGALDSLGDRWRLRPDAPTTLFNPDLTDAPQPPSASSAITSPTGVAIMPIVSPAAGLSLHQVLNFAYVGGCGFERVVTNIPDFPVAEITFTLEAGYHEAVKPLLGLYEPDYFTPDGAELWIMDGDEPLPAGLTPLLLTGADLKTIEDVGPARTPTDAIIVEYTDTAAQGDYFTERLEEDEPEETGTFGMLGYTRKDTQRKIREYRNLDAPETIVREEAAYTKETTTDWEFNVVGRETQIDSFDSLGRKRGHARTVEARVPDPANRKTLSLQTVNEETYTIFYRAGVTPTVDEIERTVSEVSGLVLVDDDKPYLDKPYEIRYTDAHASGYIDPDANQSIKFQAISTVIETYVKVGAETQVRRQPISHLNGGTVENPVSQTRAGTTRVNRRAQSVVRRMVTLAPLVPGKGHVIPSFSAGAIPGPLAIPLARRKLLRLNNPPRQVTATLPYVDSRVRRGVIVELHARGGYNLGRFIVEGYTRTYENLDTGAQKFSMVLNARQLTARMSDK